MPGLGLLVVGGKSAGYGLQCSLQQDINLVAQALKLYPPSPAPSNAEVRQRELDMRGLPLWVIPVSSSDYLKL